MKDAKGHGSNPRSAGAMPLRGHPYHGKTDAELRYIAKDASEAAKAVQGHDPRAEGKYLDQVNDAGTIMGYRQRGGQRVVSDREAAATLAGDHPKSDPVPVHDGASGRSDYGVGDHVHLGLSERGGSGFTGHITHIDNRMVRIQSDHKPLSEFGGGPRTFEGPRSRLSKY